MEKIKNFTDLFAWQEGHKLVLLIYRTTDNFPKKETYSLIDQMRRCSTSITSNIAEGFSRNTSKEKIQFYYISLGSITELQNQLIIAKDVNYLRKEDFNTLNNQTIVVRKLIYGLIKNLKTI